MNVTIKKSYLQVLLQTFIINTVVKALFIFVNFSWNFLNLICWLLPFLSLFLWMLLAICAINGHWHERTVSCCWSVHRLWCNHYCFIISHPRWVFPTMAPAATRCRAEAMLTWKMVCNHQSINIEKQLEQSSVALHSCHFLLKYHISK